MTVKFMDGLGAVDFQPSQESLVAYLVRMTFDHVSDPDGCYADPDPT